jgi:hypothetical protein
MRSFSPAMCALSAVILLSSTACNKSKPAANRANAIVPDGVPALDISTEPEILFQLFGDRASPDMMPIAAVVNGVIKPIGLTRAGWKELHDRYLAPGTKYPFYIAGSAPGELTISHDTAYTLPGCTMVKPMATVTLAFPQPRSDPTVEFLASSSPLARRAAPARKLMSSEDIAKLGREIGHTLGKRLNMSSAALDSLDFTARMIETGASNAPTLLISFIDPNAADSRAGSSTEHIFALADSGANGYVATYQHLVKGDARTIELQRLVNQVDVDADGADEIILEAWKYGERSDLVVLSFKEGRWRQVLRVKQDWCLDSPKDRK